MKINQRALETSLKMTSNTGIIVFTVIGVVIYLSAFLGGVFTSPKALATWKILLGTIGGAIFVGVLVAGSLIIMRYFMVKLVTESRDPAIK